MANTKLEFEGDVQKALAEIRKLTAETAKLREENRKLKEETVKGAEASKKALESWSNGVKSLSQQYRQQRAGADSWAAGLVNLRNQKQAHGRAMQDYIATLTRASGPMSNLTSLTGALTAASSTALGATVGLAGGIGAITTVASGAIATYTMYRAELDRLAAGLHDFHTQLVHDIALTRDFAQGAQIEKFAGSVKGATREQVLSTFSGVTAEAPTAGLERRLGVAGAGARLGVTGADMGEFGKLSGSLAEILPGEKPEDVADIAAIIHREAGGDVSKIGGTKFLRSVHKLISSGAMTRDEALGAAVSAAQGKISPETLGKMAEVASASKDKLLPGRHERGPEAAAKRKLAFASPSERLAMMHADKVVAEAGMGDQALEFSRLTPEAVAANAGMIQGARGEDTIGGILTGLQKSPAGAGAIASQTFQQERQRRSAAIARNTELGGQLSEFVRGRNAGQGIGINAISEASIFTAEVGRTIHAGTTSTSQLETENKNLALMIAALQRNAAATEDLARKRPVKNADAHNE